MAHSPNPPKTDERGATCWPSADAAYLVEAVADEEVVVPPEGDGRRRRGLWLAVVDDGDGSCTSQLASKPGMPVRIFDTIVWKSKRLAVVDIASRVVRALLHYACCNGAVAIHVRADDFGVGHCKRNSCA
jgi:hypothetical protein